MNEAERKKYDEAEASGQLPRLRLVVKSFCAPIWWEIDHKTILGNGSMCVIATPQSVFGVTANHVLTIYEGHKVAHPDMFCQLGSAPFDPIPNLIARSEHNFVRKHQTLTQQAGGIHKTPAMVAGVTDHVWTMGEVVGLLEATEK